MAIPAPTPQEKTLRRVLLISRLDGWSLLGFAIVGIGLTLLLGDWSSTAIGFLVGLAGWMEIHGHNRLQRRDPSGMRWLVRAQLFLLSVILVYCTTRLASFDEATMLDSLTPDVEALLKESGIERQDIAPMVHLTFVITYGVVAVVTLIYQGGLALYYRHRTPAVTEALAPSPPPVNHSVL